VAGPVALETPWGVVREDVQTAQPNARRPVLHARRTRTSLSRWPAVADWRVDHLSEHKIKKTANQPMPTFTFVENPDIPRDVARLPNPPYCVGFRGGKR